MWFFGMTAGLIIGMIFGSASVAIGLAILGAALAPYVFRSRKKSPQNKSPLAEKAEKTLPEKTEGEEFATLRERVSVLENRLQQLEYRLAQALPADITISEPASVPPAKPETAPASNFTAAITLPSTPAAPPVAILADEAGSASFDDDDKAQISLVEPAAAEPVKERNGAESKNPANARPAIKPPSPMHAPTGKTPPAPKPANKPLVERLPEPIRNLLFGGNALVKAGVLVLFLGLAFLLRYAAERTTVPIELRYAGVAAVGAVLLGLGWMLRQRRATYALILQGAGIGVFYLTTLAGMKFHELIPTSAGFAFLFAIAGLSALLAMLQNAQTLAVVAVLEGLAAPVLASSGSNQPIGLFTYLAILDLGIFLIAYRKSWRILNLLGLSGTLSLASGWGNRYFTADQWTTVQPFLIYFVLLFSIIGLLFARNTLRQAEDDLTESLAARTRSALQRVGRVDSSLVFGTPLGAFSLQYLLVRHLEFGPALAALGFGLFYMVLAWRVQSWRLPGLALLAEAYVIIGVMFGTLAIPLGLEGKWTGAAWALEAAAMYWLGMRQQRPYARLAAFLVLAGGAWKLLQEMTLNPLPDSPLLDGSMLGPILLSVSALTIWGIHRKSLKAADAGPRPALATVESMAITVLPWISIGALNLLPWLWFQPFIAAAVSATLAVALFMMLQRFPLAGWQHLVSALQIFATGSFLTTVHLGSASGAALANGWQAGAASAWIALSMLGTNLWTMNQVRRKAHAQQAQPRWSIVNQIALVAGVGLLHLALLFVIDLHEAAWIWPITASLTMWLAVRFSHLPLAMLAAGFQLVSAVLFMLFSKSLSVQPFMNQYFGTSLVLGLAGLFSAYWLRASASRNKPAARPSWSAVFQWPLLLWGVAWWAHAWMQDAWQGALQTQMALSTDGMLANYSTSLLVIILLTSLLMVAVAKWRDWVEMGTLALLTLPVLAWYAWMTWSGANSMAPLETVVVFQPSAHLGWLLWPLALAWHLTLLRRPPPAWKTERWLAPLHVGGFWLFLLLASLECHAILFAVADEGSSWRTLGSLLPPALALWLLPSSRLAQRWPFKDFRQAYLCVASVPVALWLMAWIWLSNLQSAGYAAPLPYLPVLNPLELAQWLSLLAMIVWWRSLQKLESAQRLLAALPKALTRLVMGVSGLALITGAVLRSCHHFAEIPWDMHSLLGSRLTQASLSLTWAICGVVVMVLGNRQHSRSAWIAGATVLGSVVVKLFLVDLADHGGLYRIISFTGVGVLLLAVGYFAPVPTKAASAPATPPLDAPSSGRENP